jgi:uncharacterized protein (DUF2384 family)
MSSLPHSRSERTATGTPRQIAGKQLHEITRYRALVSRAVDAFGDEIKASRWLSIPNRDLDGQTPLQAVQKSDYDMQVLEPILTRIEHGVDY